MMTIRLAGTDHNAVKQDVFKVLSDWNEGRDTRRLHPDMSVVEREWSDEEQAYINNPYEHVPGNRLDIVPIPDRVIEEAEYDEEGNQTKEAVYAGELRFDIRVPDAFELPELSTNVEPEKPDHRFS